MPTISVFFGIVVQMYWRDHAPPYVHAFYQGLEALVAIETAKGHSWSAAACGCRAGGELGIGAAGCVAR
jgi:hypothetical protein